MPQELLFELKDARVTPHVATFEGTSYQIANIGSVHVAGRKKSNPLAVLIFLLGLGTLAAAIVKSRMTGLADEYFSMAATGLAVMLARASPSTHLAWAGICAGFENLQWRRRCRYITQRGVCFQPSESC